MKLRLSAPLSRSFIFFSLFLSASYLSATHAELNEHFLTHFCISLWPRKYIQSETCIFWIPNHMTFVSGEIFSGDIFKSLVSSQMAFVHVRNVHTNNWTGYKAHKFVQVCHLYEWTLIKTPQISTRSIKYDDLQSMISFHRHWSKERKWIEFWFQFG